ncbi:hypothetical protein Vadar_033446 [Vaccinium darrowii]|uniref:Uncharacterized protein n=1 Tax=Vaccinium darrowii TaxID=229202 RepID=A0ACB7Z057_9ERIC|nr:hypothetical protein Vadar_033446 [Vaccinium darrowii]
MGTSNLFFLISCILLNLPLNTAQICSNSGNFTSNSTYGENRNQILSSLPSNVAANNGFFTATLTQDSETVYVLALCRGDVSSDSCFNCVKNTSQTILKNCPNQKEATNYGDYDSKCIVRCSNTSFFNVMETQPPRFIYIASDITSAVDEFDQALNSLVESLVIRAAMGNSTKFATRESKFGGYLHIYGLMQCVPGISSVDCSRCLRGAVDEYRNCCFRKRGANVLRPSCTFQYDLIPFFESSAGTAPPPVTFAPPLPPVAKEGSKSSKLQTTTIIVVLVSIIIVIVGLGCACFLVRKKEIFKKSFPGFPFNSAWIKAAGKLFRVSKQCGAHHAGEDVSQSSSSDSLKFEFATIRAVTNDFSNANMLGHGRFGSVYKGKLPNGQEIAVKRLDDEEMNPKIAGFGMARLFVVDQSTGITKRISGSPGYMPPEYVQYGQYSVKTDVFSFGVLILEIVSGKKYSGYGDPKHEEHLISYAWKKWRQGKASTLVDVTLADSSKSEKMRCIHIGLLCVQENVAKRPTMSAVVLMFNSFSMSLPLPSKPAFLVESSMELNTALGNRFPSATNSHHSTEHPVNVSINEASIIDPETRMLDSI